jgi:hypothetical protein
MHFPQIFSFVGKGADDDAKRINCLYTLDPKARPWADNVLLVPIDRIESNLLVGRRTKSLVLIPRLVDQDPWAQLRRPMDMIRQG